MSGEPGTAADERTWDVLNRGEEDTLGWLRDLRDDLVIRRGGIDAQAFLSALIGAGAVTVGPAETGSTGTRHGFRRGDVQFAIELESETPARIRIRFGRAGP
jgi:hypothetical protein